MLNLLFISDSPKAEHVKSVLQPLLKVIIDVVTDFDHGLKDVFEKRPTAVCIQDQIGGVTGESVARHIQMLLGSSAPTFILLHTENVKARAIKGLYEHVVDMGQGNEAVVENITNALKSLLGEQWEKIYIPPKLTPAEVISSVAVAEESRIDAERLVDDFLSDLETSGFKVIEDQPELTADSKIRDELAVAGEPVKKALNIIEDKKDANVDRGQVSSDQLAEMLLAEVAKELPTAVHPVDKPEPEVVFTVESTTNTKNEVTPILPIEPDLPPLRVAASNVEANPVTAHSAIDDKNVKSTPLSHSTPPVAEFKVIRDTPAAEEQIPEELLLAFEENYRSESMFLKRSIVIGLLCLLAAVGTWYLFKQKPQLLTSLKQRFVSPKVAPSPVPVTSPKPVPLPVQPLQVVQTLPAFIPKDSLDATYGAKNPGWERYQGKTAEFRLFSGAGRLQAVQVLAKESAIPEALLKTVMKEFAGSVDYSITTRSKNAGILIEKGRVNDKGDIIIYRKNRAIKAFVVSIN